MAVAAQDLEDAWNPLAILEQGTVAASDKDAEMPSAYLLFTLGGQNLAVRVADVREIIDDKTVTPLLRAPHLVEGMIDVRNTSIAVIDLAAALGLPQGGLATSGRIVVFEFTGADEGALPIGVRTDAVRNVIEIAAQDIEPAPRTMQDWDASIIEGVTRQNGDLVVVVNLHAVFDPASESAGMFDFS